MGPKTPVRVCLVCRGFRNNGTENTWWARPCACHIFSQQWNRETPYGSVHVLSVVFFATVGQENTLWAGPCLSVMFIVATDRKTPYGHAQVCRDFHNNRTGNHCFATIEIRGSRCCTRGPRNISVLEWPKAQQLPMVLHDVVWSTPLERQCTPKSAPLQPYSAFFPGRATRMAWSD
jgi:hypothetical protein